MKRTLIKTAVVAACLTSVAAPSYAFDFFGLFKSDAGIEDMIEYVPADTALFFGGISTKAMVTSSDSLLSGYDYNTLNAGLTELSSLFSASAGAELALWLLDDYYAVVPDGGEAVYAHYGFDINGAAVLYMDGLLPVVRVGLSDEAAFLNVLQKGAEESGIELGTATVGGKTLTTVELLDEDGVKFQLAFLVNDKVLTMSVLTNKETASAKALRFALVAPPESMAPELWAADGKAYGYTEDFRGFVSLLNIVTSVLNEDSTVYQQVLTFVGSDVPKDFADFQGQCKSDVINMVAGMPRIVAGLKDYDVTDNSLMAAFNYALEIKNEGILAELAKLRGFNPAYIHGNDQLAVGVSVGITADGLTPVLTSLWNQFTTADFDCEQLQDLQAEASSFNPSAIALFTGMAQGLSGISAGIFDIVVDDSPLGGSIDAIATITAEKPDVIAALITNFLPIAQGIQIPTDGSSVNLADTGFPMDMFLAIKGQHLVAYSGNNASKVADELANETATVNGLTAYSLDYKKVADLVINAAIPLHAWSDSDDCTDMYTMAVTLKGLSANLTGGDDITANGLETDITVSIDNAQQLMNLYGVDIVGDYDLAFLDYDCSWVDIGSETLSADGTGLYVEQDEAGVCNVFESRYNWVSSLGAMIQSDSENQYRDFCEDEWVNDDPYDFKCQVLANDDTGFYCLETGYDENTLHRYTKK